MKKSFVSATLFFLIIGVAGSADAGNLENFLSNLNMQCKADMSGCSVRLSSQFGVPLPQVQTVIRTVDTFSDAFMCYQLGQMTYKQPETVVQTYKRNKGKGWGVIAKELGIKPGSAEFHALKSGNFALTGVPGGNTADTGQGKAKGKGKGKGHNK